MPFEETKSSSDAIALLKTRLSGFETEEGRLSGLNYVPKSKNEVMITTTPKAGTTWLQQICHQLRSATNGGDMSFTEISEVVPWIELAHDQGQDLDAPQYGDAEGLPRLFKTHAWEGHCPKGCKKIVVLRNPMDVVVSFYKFFENWFFEAGTVGIDEFAREFWLARGVPDSKMTNASYFVHLISWYKTTSRRDQQQEDVLILFFEDLKEDLEREVRRVAAFMSTDEHDFTTDDCIAIVTQRASFAFMKEHSDQFDEKLSKLTRNEACGLPLTAGVNVASKVNHGQSGAGGKALSEQIQNDLRAKWMEVVEPVTGCSTYEELRRSFRNK